MASVNKITKITGRLFEHQSSDFSDCALIIEDGEAFTEIFGLDRQSIGQFSKIKIQPRLGSFAQKLTLPDGRVFETEDLEAVEALKPGGFWNKVARSEKTGWHLLPMAIATPFLAFGLYKLMIPVLITMGMAVTPDQALWAIDKNSMATMEALVLEPSNIPDERQAELTEIFEQLLAAKNRKGSLSDRNFKYVLLFKDADKIGPNAFALPGGTIVVTDDLIEQFEDDDIIAAVLGHEIGHVDEQHSLRQIYRSLGIWYLVTMIAGDSGEILEDMLLEGSALLSLSYSRDHEMSSDNYSYDLLKEAGLPTDGMVHFFDQLSKNYPVPKDGEWAQSHPIAENRINNIIERIKADGGPLPIRKIDQDNDDGDDAKSEDSSDVQD